jgi:hypothetical protein
MLGVIYLIHSWWFRVPVTLLLVLLYFVFADRLVTSPFMAKTLEIVQQESSNNKRFVVVFTPTQVGAETYTREQRPLLAEYGQVAAIGYPRQYANRKRIVKESFNTLKVMYAEHIARYGLPEDTPKELALNGASVGTQFLFDFIRYNRKMGNYFTITSAVLDDPVMDGDDIANQGAKVFKLWHPGLANNLAFNLLDKVGIRIPFNPPPPEEGADAVLLEKHHDISKHWPMSGLGDLIRISITSKQPQPGEFKDIPMRALSSTGDTVLRKTWIAKAAKAFGTDPAAMVVEVRSAHCDWPAFPKATNAALAAVYKELYPNG